MISGESICVLIVRRVDIKRFLGEVSANIPARSCSEAGPEEGNSAEPLQINKVLTRLD